MKLKDYVLSIVLSTVIFVGYKGIHYIKQSTILNQEMSTTVKLTTKNGILCSGVIISKHGHILTCAHCLMSSHSPIVTITLNSGWSMGGRIVLIDSKHDLALVYLGRPYNEMFSYSKLSTKEVSITDFVRIIGHPLDLDWTVTEGIVSGVGGRLREGLIQTNTVVNPGNSGGPVFNDEGQLIGIAESIVSVNSFPIFTGQALFIPITAIKKFLNNVNMEIDYAKT